VLDVLSLLAFTLFASLVAWYGWGVFYQSYVSDSHSQSAIEMPLVFPQGLWFAGLAFFVAVAFLLLARALRAWFRGDLDELFRVIGSKSAVEEAKEEVVAVEHGLEAEHKQ
jgi:TRAP-type C4-dicarboxylate transport system permease small subunit